MEHGLSSVMSGMDNVRNMTGSPIAGIDPHEFLDVRPLNYGAPSATLLPAAPCVVPCWQVYCWPALLLAVVFLPRTQKRAGQQKKDA